MPMKLLSRYSPYFILSEPKKSPSRSLERLVTRSTSETRNRCRLFSS